MDFSDAIALHAVHTADTANMSNAAQRGGAVQGKAGLTVESLRQQFARQQAALVSTIVASCAPGGSEARIRWPGPRPGDSREMQEEAGRFAPYFRFYLAHQREMEQGVRPLRQRLRDALAGFTPSLKRLASLDAALEPILFEQERKQLATVPVLLEKRFLWRQGGHQAALEVGGGVDDPFIWMQPGQWLAGFCQDMQGLLLAELDLRLQPALGLLEAISHEAVKQR